MKKLLKLYKMFYRLLRLKAWQRREIETHNRSEYARTLASIYNEYFAVKTELNDYKQVMLQHRIHSSVELFRALENQPIKEDLTKAEFVALRERLKAQYNN